MLITRRQRSFLAMDRFCVYLRALTSREVCESRSVLEEDQLIEAPIARILTIIIVIISSVKVKPQFFFGISIYRTFSIVNRNCIITEKLYR